MSKPTIHQKTAREREKARATYKRNQQGLRRAYPEWYAVHEQYLGALEADIKEIPQTWRPGRQG